jgi:uncharacterized protein YpmS
MRGTNKEIFYKIFYTADEINEEAIVKLIKEAVELDNQFIPAVKKEKSRM